MQITWTCFGILGDDLHDIFAFTNGKMFTFLVQNLQIIPPSRLTATSPPRPLLWKEVIVLARLNDLQEELLLSPRCRPPRLHPRPCPPFGCYRLY